MECVIWIVNMHVFIFAELTFKHFRIFMGQVQMLMLLYDLNLLEQQFVAIQVVC